MENSYLVIADGFAERDALASLKQSYRPAIALARARAYCSGNSPRARARICCDITPATGFESHGKKKPRSMDERGCKVTEAGGLSKAR